MRRRNQTDSRQESSSASGTASHTPSTSSSRGSRSSPSSRKPKVRANEIMAEVRPLDRAVKRAEEKIFTPAKRKAGANRRKPSRAMAYTGEPGVEKIPTTTPDRARATARIATDETRINRRQ